MVPSLAASQSASVRSSKITPLTAIRWFRGNLIALMDIWIPPSQAPEYGLIDEIVSLAGQEEAPAAFVAATGSRIRLTAVMRQRYQEHMATETESTQRNVQAICAPARIKALASC